jgi:hypothetical protein
VITTFSRYYSPVAILKKYATTFMINNSLPHSHQIIVLHQEKQQKTKTARGDVRQDKRRSQPPRSAAAQPAAGTKIARAVGMNTKTPRAQNSKVNEKRTAKLTIWVEPRVKEAYQRKADREGGYLSSVCAEALKAYLQQDADIHYSATLKPLIEATIDRRMIARDNRLASLLVRACIAIEQTRTIAVNTLGRQPRVNPAVLNDILDHSLDAAKKKITNRSPELKELIRELNSYLLEQEQ